MILNTFKPSQFERGQKYSFDLSLDPWVKNVSLPVLLVRGRRGGKTLVATAGVHGDEYEGVRAIFETFQSLNPDEMSGDFLAVPVANPPAFWNGTRTSPLDQADLARAFPGDLDGGPTAVIAHVLANSVIAQADFFVDLHSAGVKLLMPSMAGYDAADERSRNAAMIFGARVIWGHPETAPGRTISFAKQHGIPWLYTEARGAGRIHPDDLRMFLDGIQNLLRLLRILAGDPTPAKIETHLLGSGDIDTSLVATKQGFLIADVDLLQPVRAGQRLGRVVDLHSEMLESFASPRDGVVALIRQWPVVMPGDGTFMVTGVLE
ncbi:MAG: M14 family metallopeptidase [Candidatus Acidiferrales bacterium]